MRGFEGFRLCSVRGDCGPWSLKSYTSAAKTGTAQYYDGGVEYRNNSFVFYAPVEEPEMTAIVFTVVLTGLTIIILISVEQLR